MYSRFSAAVRFSEPPLGTRFRALGGQPCAPTPQSWLRIPGVDRQPGRLRPRRRLHTSDPRREEISCRLASAYRVSPATNSCATCRLNSMLWERCLAMAFVLRKPSSTCQIRNLNLSGPRGALQAMAAFLSLLQDERTCSVQNCCGAN